MLSNTTMRSAWQYSGWVIGDDVHICSHEPLKNIPLSAGWLVVIGDYTADYCIWCVWHHHSPSFSQDLERAAFHGLPALWKIHPSNLTTSVPTEMCRIAFSDKWRIFCQIEKVTMGWMTMGHLLTPGFCLREHRIPFEAVQAPHSGGRFPRREVALPKGKSHKSLGFLELSSGWLVIAGSVPSWFIDVYWGLWYPQIKVAVQRTRCTSRLPSSSKWIWTVICLIILQKHRWWNGWLIDYIVLFAVLGVFKHSVGPIWVRVIGRVLKDTKATTTHETCYATCHEKPKPMNLVLVSSHSQITMTLSVKAFSDYEQSPRITNYLFATMNYEPSSIISSLFRPFFFHHEFTLFQVSNINLPSPFCWASTISSPSLTTH